MLILKRVDCNDGVAAYIESLIRGLREAGDRVVVVSGQVTTLFGSETRRKAIQEQAFAWEIIEGLGRPFRTLTALRTIRSLIHQYDVDVLSPQGFKVLPVSYLAGRLSGRPLVANFHLVQKNVSMTQRLAYCGVSTAFRADHYLAMSSEIADFFEKRCGIPPYLIYKRLPGVDTDFFRRPTDSERSDARERFRLAASTLVAILPGRINRSKGHGVAVAALRALRITRPDISVACLFAGDGDEREEIESETLLTAADHETFRFLGFLARDYLREAYWASDIVLLPSYSEGFGLVVAEAMCCGAIVIRTPGGGCGDQVVEGETGYVVPFGDSTALSSAVERFADSPDRKVMREKAMQLASVHFAFTSMIDGTSNLYREVAAVRHDLRP